MLQSLEQQSRSSMQKALSPRHWQKPVTQLMEPQQSLPKAQMPNDSTQQRAEKETPRRQLSVRQQSVSMVQESVTSWQIPVHEARRQSEQLPVVGPEASPERQVLESAHQPQSRVSPRSVQAVHTPSALQGSAPPPHSLESHCQSGSEQLPSVAPVLVPRWQVLVPGHHPQTPELSRVQAAQSVLSPQLSMGALHSLESHFQSGSEQVLSSAPVLVPRWQLPAVAHQPQTKDRSRVQESQSVFDGQVSGSAAQVEPAPNSQPLAQEPPLGPDASPTMQASLPPHQPQFRVALPVQAPQVV